MTVETIGEHPARGGLAIPTPTEAVTAAIHSWVSGLDIATRGADFVVDTPGCPDSFWPLPPGTQVKDIPGRNPKLQLPSEDRESYLTRRGIAVRTVGYIVRYGLGLGLAPEVALTGIFLIGGRPAMYAEQMVALVKARGHGHRVVERGAERCVVEVRRRDEGVWQLFEFTMADAEAAGYVPQKGPHAGKEAWKGGNAKYLTDPAAMLYARASSIACRTVFPEELRGMVTVEEARDQQHDVIEGTATDTGRSVPKVTTAQILGGREPAPAEASTSPEVAAATSQVNDEGATSAPADGHGVVISQVETGEGITRSQQTKLGAIFGDLGVKGRPERLLISAALADLPDGTALATSSELTKRQASALIDRLDQLVAKPESERKAAVRFLLGQPELSAEDEGPDADLLSGAEVRCEEA